MRYLIIFLFTLFYTTPYIYSKTIEDYVLLQLLASTKSKYIGRFSTNPHETAQFNLKAKFKKSPTQSQTSQKALLDLFAFDKQTWTVLQKSSPSCSTLFELAKVNAKIEIPLDGSWSDDINQGLPANDHGNIWYFSLGCCETSLEKYRNLFLALDYTLEVTQGSNRNHLSAEENGISNILLVYIVIMALFLSINTKRFLSFLRKEEQTDYPFLMTNIAIGLEFLSAFSEFIHLMISSYNGKGSGFLDYLSQSFSLLSQLLICCLLILVSAGWSIDFINFEDMEVYFPAMGLAAILHLILIAIAKFAMKDGETDHDYDTIPGYIMISLRLLIFIIFSYFLWISWRSTREAKKKAFLAQLGTIGGTYLMTFPFIIGLAKFTIQPINQHKFVTIGVVGVQLLATIVLTVLFTQKKGKYYQMIYGSTGILTADENKFD